MNDIVKTNINSKLIVNKIADYLDLQTLKNFILAHGTKVKCNIESFEHIIRIKKTDKSDEGVEYIYYRLYAYDCIEYKRKLYVKSNITKEFVPVDYLNNLRLADECKYIIDDYEF